MRKLLITNIIIGSLFGVFAAFAIKYFTEMIGYTAMVKYGEPLSEVHLYILNMSHITQQTIIGFLVSIIIMVVMWKQTKKINDKSILFLGGPILSIFAALFYYNVSSKLWDYMYRETPYILLAFILFFSLLQLVMYYIVKEKQKI